MSEWISVKERLPELGERVLVCWEVFVGEGHLSKRGMFVRWNYEGIPAVTMPATHWMPLPEPPGEEYP